MIQTRDKLLSDTLLSLNSWLRITLSNFGKTEGLKELSEKLHMKAI